MSTSSLWILDEHEKKPGVIDEVHLGRMTLGDVGLEREVLEIFARQAALMLKRVASADPTLAGAAAHTLKGSARGIGAWRLAHAAERVEEAVARPRSPALLDAAIAEFKAASLEVCAAIRRYLESGSSAAPAEASETFPREH